MHQLEIIDPCIHGYIRFNTINHITAGDVLYDVNNELFWEDYFVTDLIYNYALVRAFNNG